MTRTTVDYGIDLGTTNSAIAVINGVNTEIIKNNEDAETTPSAIWIDKRNRLMVGRVAKERSERYPKDTAAEFKLQMGLNGEPKEFEAAGRTMGPEELSAEVLKSLRGDVLQRKSEDIDAAVITVPAAFDLSSCDATKRAAELAGLAHTPLLQEPTAAALAYGFQTTADNVFWLAYDFGGGTFDAAVIHVRDGEFTVVDHQGDNYLGGKLIDWKIVEELLIPAAAEQAPVSGLARGVPEWLGAINSLKLAAERAKIQLSRAETAEIVVEMDDENGREFDFEYQLRRADLERISEPFIVRSINLCRTALAGRALGSGDIEKVLLVGGQTLSPYLRERLADPRAGLGIPLDHSQDPNTVVARGAAIFAGTQRLDTARPAAPPPPAGAYAVDLEYSPVGPDTEPFVAGRVTGGDTAGLSIEFVNEDGVGWRSGKLALTADGAFAATLLAERGIRNTFVIELTDATGTRRPVTPGRIPYTVGTVDTQPPLTHAVGIGLESNEVERLMERGTPLPATRRIKLRTTVAVNRGRGSGMIRIPVVEGEYDRADRNRFIGRLEIEPDQVMRDVPEGSSVELTLKIDESRLVVTRAYVPILDEEFEHVLNLQTETVPSYEELSEDAAFEKLRLDEIRGRVAELRDERARGVLRRIDEERIVEDVDGLVAAARNDPDAAATCAKRLRDLKAAVDDVEEALRWPELVHEADEMVPAVRRLIEAYGNARHERAFTATDTAIRDAIAAQDADLLRQRLDDLHVVAARVLDETGELQYLAFDQLREMRTEMRDPAAASRLIAEGEQAAAARDDKRLERINDRLRDMLPAPPPPPDPFSTVRRDR